MLLSFVFAWIAVIFVIISAFKFIARVSKSVKLNHFFHKIHVWAGILLILTGLMHGLFAGNFPETSLSDMQIGAVLFTFNWGTACFAVSVLLGISYLLRKALKKNWMGLHRILTVVLIALVVVHVVDVGIQLPSRLFGKTNQSASRLPGKDNQPSTDVDMNTIEVSNSFSGAKLKDGVYEGAAEGYKSTIKVSVEVVDGAVVNVEIVEQNESSGYFERACTIIDDIVNKQSLNLDAVSGATYSSVAILNAVNDALESAVVEGTLEKSDAEMPTEHYKHHGERHGKNKM